MPGGPKTMTRARRLELERWAQDRGIQIEEDLEALLKVIDKGVEE